MSSWALALLLVLATPASLAAGTPSPSDASCPAGVGPDVDGGCPAMEKEHLLIQRERGQLALHGRSAGDGVASNLAAAGADAGLGGCRDPCRRGSETYSCYGRTVWSTQNQQPLSFQRSLSQVNNECAGQCACSAADFPADIVAVGAAPTWAPTVETPAPTAATPATTTIGVAGSGPVYGQGSWCAAQAPPEGWTLNDCTADGGSKQEVKVLTYNLYWWNLFGQRGGNGGSAGKLIAANNQGTPYDFMGFQECDDVRRVLGDAGLAGQFQAVPGGSHAVAIAYRAAAWQLLESGVQPVAEDRKDQYYGTRVLHWARFQSASGSGKAVLFACHHGPLPVGTGGLCGRRATAYNLLKAIADRRRQGDAVILVGDVNSPTGNREVQEVAARLHKVFSGSAIGGIDHVFSSCGQQHVRAVRNLGKGGSDHDALDVVLEV